MSKEQKLLNFNMELINFFGKIKMLHNFLFDHSSFSLLKRNQKLMDYKKHDKCFVCALGPSLKGVDLSKINADSIVVNRFYKIGKQFPNFIPTYYLMLDHLFDKPENRHDFEEALVSYLDKGTVFILNSKLAKMPIMEKYKNYKNIYYISSFNGTLQPDKKYSIDGVMPSFQNVVGASIFILILMGYKKVSLLGCDFNSFASSVKNHCYSEKNNARSMALSFELFCYSIAAKNHDDLQTYAIHNGVQIFNSTKGSLIDSYPFKIDEDLYFNDEKVD